ncbi:hypothetical protein DSECCO2_408860 [anaerobic digester metagenome]
MAFSKTERWSRRLDDLEKDINKYHRWTTGEVVPLTDAVPKFHYAVTKLTLQMDHCQS